LAGFISVPARGEAPALRQGSTSAEQPAQTQQVNSKIIERKMQKTKEACIKSVQLKHQRSEKIT
jgi:hypothetical protein